MCGPSADQERIAGREDTFSSLLNSHYQKNFDAQSQILQQLTSMFTPIAQAGPDQQGFGPQELAALNTESGSGVGANYAKASQALNNTLAARGGGNEVLPTGSSAALRGQLASSAANELSQEQSAITRANYSQGRSNWSQATAGLNALAGEYNPEAIANSASSATQSAFGDATKVQEMKNQREMAIAGGITSLASGFLTGGVSNLMSGGRQAGSETGGGAEQFFSGGLNGLGFGG